MEKTETLRRTLLSQFYRKNRFCAVGCRVFRLAFRHAESDDLMDHAAAHRFDFR